MSRKRKNPIFELNGRVDSLCVEVATLRERIDNLSERFVELKQGLASLEKKLWAFLLTILGTLLVVLVRLVG